MRSALLSLLLHLKLTFSLSHSLSIHLIIYRSIYLSMHLSFIHMSLSIFSARSHLDIRANLHPSSSEHCQNLLQTYSSVLESQHAVLPLCVSNLWWSQPHIRAHSLTLVLHSYLHTTCQKFEHNVLNILTQHV